MTASEETKGTEVAGSYPKFAGDLSRSELEDIVDCVRETLESGRLKDMGYTPCWLALVPLMGREWVNQAMDESIAPRIKKSILQEVASDAE